MPDVPLSSTAIILTQRLATNPEVGEPLLLPLAAAERTRSRHRCETADGQTVQLQLPRGTVLRDGDWLRSQDGVIVRVVAKPEPVLTVTAPSSLALLQAAYHLGNRHVALEIAPTYLRLSPDAVLQEMLKQRGLTVIEEIHPFEPEGGAYGSHHH